MRFGLAAEFANGSGSTRWRTLLCAGVGVVALATAVPAEANWFFDQPEPIMRPERPFADTRALAIKRQQAKRKRAADAVAGLKSSAAEKIPGGPVQIVISLKQQRLTVYANGQPVAHSPVSTGVPGHPTPLGIFSVIQKAIYHESNIYSDAPMPYMQRITWSGVAMHQGVVPGRPASHGCIRLPREFAQRLWRYTKLGARVIIAQDDARLADIASPHLFGAKADVVSQSAPAPVEKIRLATAGGMPDAPLKGAIDPATEQARIESTIDAAVAAGQTEAEAYLGVTTPERSALQKSALTGSAKDPMLKPGPISVFISRKQGMIYVRKGFSPVLESPVTIAQGDVPLGTHVFTALRSDDSGALRWNVVSLPTERLVKKGKYVETLTRRGEKLRQEVVAPQHEAMPAGDPNAALERITVPEATLARITALMTPGASLIVSDLGQSFETGAGTDFIVLTR